jgi:uncharacterized protein with HEPN domain
MSEKFLIYLKDISKAIDSINKFERGITFDQLKTMIKLRVL